MSSLRDGLGQEELQVSGVELSGTNAVYTSPYFLGSVTSESNISGVNLYATTNVAGTNLSGTTSIVSPYASLTTISGTNFVNSQGLLKSTNVTGSRYGAIVQAGSGTLSSNKLWVAYNVVYAGKPVVVTACTTSGTNADIWINAGSITAGSFCAYGVGASDTFSWISVGI